MNIVIQGEFPTMNQIIAASKSHYAVYAKMKRTYTTMAHYSLRNVEKIDYKASITFTWYRKNRRSDPDNISAGGCKVILDAMVETGVLDNDGWSQIGELKHKFAIDKDNPRVELIITPSNS